MVKYYIEPNSCSPPSHQTRLLLDDKDRIERLVSQSMTPRLTAGTSEWGVQNNRSEGYMIII